MMLGYHDKFDEGITFKTEKAFMKHRLQKIYLLYMITMGIFILYGIAGDVILRGGGIELLIEYLIKTVLSVTMLQSLIPYYSYALCFNSVAWFLSVIVVLYMVTPFLIKMVKRLGGGKMLGISVGGFVVLYKVFGRLEGNMPDCSLTHTTPYINVFFYLIGMSLAYLYLHGGRRLSAKVCTILEVLSAMVCMVLNLGYREVGKYGLLYRVMMILVLSLLICSMAYEKGILSAILKKSRILSGIGRISFEVYLIHYPVCTIGFHFLNRIWKPAAGMYLLYFVLFWCVTLFLAVLYKRLAAKKKEM